MAKTGGGADGAAIESGRLVGLLGMAPPYAAMYVTSSGLVLNV